MRITRLYHSEQLACGEEIFLNPETSNHLIRVLRTKINSPVIIFNGDGFDYQCKTLDANNKKTRVLVESKIKLNNESHLQLTLFQGLSRQDRMETSIQKSVELGVTQIIPVICQRSNIKFNKDKFNKKLDHWQKIAISACEQSGRSIIPEVCDIMLLTDIVSEKNQDCLKIALDPKAEVSFDDLKNKLKETPFTVELIIGPEGGLTDKEITFLNNKYFSSVSLGPRILRTETAGPAAISGIQILWGDL